MPAVALSATPVATPGLVARRAHVREPDPGRAVGLLREQLATDDASAVLLFCSGRYDLDQLGTAIARELRAPVVACTGDAQIGPSGYEQGGITGLSLHGPDLQMRPVLLSPLSLCQSQAGTVAREHAARMAGRPGARSFGLLLVDGLSLWEDYVAAALYESLGDVPVVGGSASPPPGQAAAAVYHDGRFSKGAAVLALCETERLAFECFSTHHFSASDQKLVITLADPERRLVYEINGEPAAHTYAAALGLEPAQLSVAHFASHPLLLDLGEQLLPRAIRAQNPDGSLSMACAIDEGLVVSIATSSDPVKVLKRELDEVQRRLPDPAALIVFDSALRRIELEQRGLDREVGQLLAERRALGFCGLGEQLGPLHANHTLTGIALGPPRAGEHP